MVSKLVMNNFAALGVKLVTKSQAERPFLQIQNSISEDHTEKS